jgi:hypothetical protein
VTIDEAVGAGLGTLAAVAALVRTAARRVQTEIETVAQPVLRVAQRLPLGRSADAPAPAPPLVAPGGGPREQVEDTKYWVGGGRSRAPVEHERAELPRHYGTDRLVLLARDPWWVFAWWEITPGTRVEALRTLGDDADGARDVLRLHDGTLADAATNPTFVDVEFAPGAESWYVNVGRPGATLCAEVGLRTASGRFVRLTRSNTIRMPPAQPAGPSPVRWATLRPAASGGPGVAWSERSAAADVPSDSSPPAAPAR